MTSRQVAGTAGADFAFVLSQAGLLVTRDAPRDMPDRGRMKILWACPKGKNGEVVHLEPAARDELVPRLTGQGRARGCVRGARGGRTAILVAVCAT
ncbi:MAG: hypothetical protein R3F14_31335 [Polyangiaceae bacterium]